jgi:hypothetical protein
VAILLVPAKIVDDILLMGKQTDAAAHYEAIAIATLIEWTAGSGLLSSNQGK